MKSEGRGIKRKRTCREEGCGRRGDSSHGKKHQGHHKSGHATPHHGIIKPSRKGHGRHSVHKHSEENSVEFLRNEAQRLEEQLRSINQRIKAMEEGKIPSELKAKINSELCVACGECVEACRKHRAITVGAIAVVDEERCVGCGQCVESCDKGSITL